MECLLGLLGFSIFSEVVFHILSEILCSKESGFPIVYGLTRLKCLRLVGNIKFVNDLPTLNTILYFPVVVNKDDG